MRNIHSTAVVLFTFIAMTVSGCGSDGFVPASGTVTHDGKPVPKLSVVFSPQPVGDNHAVGPFSSGVTDSAGKFTLKTRYGDSGAVVGKHALALEYSDIGESAMTDLREAMNDAKDSGSSEEFNESKKKLAEIRKKLKGRPVLKGRYEQLIDIPAGGNQDLKIELTEFTSKK